MGGFSGTSTYYNDVMKYTTTTNTWNTIIPSSGTYTGRYCHTATLYNDGIYIISGRGSSGTINDLKLFNITTTIWTTITPTSGSLFSRQSHTATLYNDDIYVIGGYNPTGEQRNDVVKYSITDNTWTDITSSSGTLLEREGHTATLYNDEIYVIGGKLQGNVPITLTLTLTLTLRWYCHK